MSTDYDHTIEFLAAGFLIRDRMSPEMVECWHAEFHRAVELRGGLVGDRYVDKSIAKDVLSEVAERATRRLAGDLVPRLHEHMADADVGRVEAELSNALRTVLDHIAVAKL
jgi:hypothetical protein